MRCIFTRNQRRGNTKIAMPVLKTAFEALGLSDVKPYINNGNVICNAEYGDTDTRKCFTILPPDMIQIGYDIAHASTKKEQSRAKDGADCSF